MKSHLTIRDATLPTSKHFTHTGSSPPGFQQIPSDGANQPSTTLSHALELFLLDLEPPLVLSAVRN